MMKTDNQNTKPTGGKPGAKEYRKMLYVAADATQGRKYYYDYAECWYVPDGVTPPKISHPASLKKRGIYVIYLGRWPASSRDGQLRKDAMQKYESLPDTTTTPKLLEVYQ